MSFEAVGQTSQQSNKSALSNHSERIYQRLGRHRSLLNNVAKPEAAKAVEQQRHNTSTLRQQDEPLEDSLQREQRRHPGHTLSAPDDREKLARLLQRLGLSVDGVGPDDVLHFAWDEITGLVHLWCNNEQVLASFTPKEVQQLTAELTQSEGWMTDRVG